MTRHTRVTGLGKLVMRKRDYFPGHVAIFLTEKFGQFMLINRRKDEDLEMKMKMKIMMRIKRRMKTR